MIHRKISQQYSSIQFPYRSLVYAATKIAAIWISVLLLLCIQTSIAQTISFSGDAEADFSGVEGVFVIDDTPLGFPLNPDVGVPSLLGTVISGWDIKSVYFATDLDHLFVGIDYFGIAGDADGNGDPGVASNGLISLGGQDIPEIGRSESIALAIDLDQDGIFELAAGVPAGNPIGLPELGCVNFDINDCFGLYSHSGGPANQQGTNFASLIDGTNTLFASPSASAPDIEFTINWSNISEETGDGIGSNECTTFFFDINIFSGSFLDDGIGEDFVPSGNGISTVELEVCKDCEGTIFGTQTIDLCGECGGDNSSCGIKTISFTGNPESDFSGEGIFVVDDGVPDVGVPGQIPGNISGWDIEKVYFFTNIRELYIGVDYFGIAGDADGDGFPSDASTELESIGGQDLPDMARTETLAIQMDLNLDGIFDVIAGVPTGDPIGGSLGCPNFDLNDCFGVYNYLDTSSVSVGSRFLSLTDFDSNLFALPSSDVPDIEFNIENWDELAGWDDIEPNTCQTFEFDIQIFSGSFEDAGIGEDFIPSQQSATTVSLEVCADCEGIPFGPNVNDGCGICGGDGSTCAGTCDCSDPGAILEGSNFGNKTYFFGTFGDDIICGSDENDVIFGFGGNDCIDSAGGNDKVFAGFGHDIVDLGLGDDKAFGGPGDDDIDGNEGSDTIFGGFGFDTCLGETVLFCEQ